MEKRFEKFTFTKRLKSMLHVDFKRLFISPFFYIILGISFAVPILILVMTTLMDGSVSVDPQTGKETIIEGFDYVWQILGSISGSTANNQQMSMEMDLVSMCNINMMFFGIAVLVCIFISEDFKSGYAKNLFTVRSNKVDYVISKTLVCFIGSALCFIAFFIGAIIGGGVASLPFLTIGITNLNVVFSLLSKICLAPVFVSIFTLMSVISKQKTWLSILLSLGVGMLLFMMIPALTPLNATIINVFSCLLAGIVFSIGLGAISNFILKKTSLI